MGEKESYVGIQSKDVEMGREREDLTFQKVVLLEFDFRI